MIVSYRDHLLEVWRDAHAEWSLIDTYVQGNFALWPSNLASKRPDYHSPRGRAIVDHAVDNQLSHDPIVHRFPAGKGEKHETLADKIEPYLKAVMEEAALKEPSLTFKQVGRNLVQYGYSVVEGPILEMRHRPEEPVRKDATDDEDWKHMEVLYKNQKKMWMPFRVRCPHPSRVLMEPLDKEPVFAIKHAHRYSYELNDMTIKRKGKRSKGTVNVWDVGENPFELVLVDEWWSTTWHAVLAQGSEHQIGRYSQSLLFVEKNTWGFLPYAHAFSGWGSEPTSGMQESSMQSIFNSSLNPKYLAVGLLTSQVRETLKMESQQKAGRHNGIMEAMFNTLQTTMPAEELAAQRARGDVVEVPDQGAVKWMEVPQLPNWVMDGERRLAEDLEYGTFSSSNAGLRQQGVSTVGQEAILSQASSQKFVAPGQQMNHLGTIVGMNILRLIDVLGETMYCRGETISPSDIEHDYSLQVTFEVFDPVLQLQERQMGMAEVQAGLKSKETYWSSDANLEDASGERIRLLEDAVRADPKVHALLANEVAQQMGLMDMINSPEAGPVPMPGEAPTSGIPGGPPGAVGNEPQGAPPGAGPPPGMPAIAGPDGLPMNAGSMGKSKAMRTPPKVKLPKPLTQNVAKPKRVKASAFDRSGQNG